VLLLWKCVDTWDILLLQFICLGRRGNCLCLKVLNILLLVPTLLVVARGSYVELEEERVLLGVDIPLLLEQLVIEESVIPPALAGLKVAGELPRHAQLRVPQVNHLNPAFILTGLLQPLDHLQKHGDELPLRLPVSIWIDLKAPGEAVSVQRVAEDHLAGLPRLAVVPEVELGAIVLRDDLAFKVRADVGIPDLCAGLILDIAKHLHKVGRLRDEGTLGTGLELVVDLNMHAFQQLDLLGKHRLPRG
jgi:hypothetical protein